MYGAARSSVIAKRTSGWRTRSDSRASWSRRRSIRIMGPSPPIARARFPMQPLGSSLMSDARTIAPSPQELLKRMAGRRILVVGDAMLDDWIWGSVTRISPEAPVPVVAVRDHTFTLGGAGNVANNLRALGAQVAVVGVVGEDAEGERVRALFAENDVDASGIVV